MNAPQLKLVTNDDIDRELADAQGEIDAARKANAITKIRRPADVLPPEGDRRYDDLANAELFLQSFGDDLLYCAEPKRWMYWDGTHWKLDGEQFVFQLATEFAKGLYLDVTDADSFKNAKRANMRAGIDAFLSIAERKKTASITSFDTDPLLLNCKNGTLHLHSGEMRPHRREDRITRVVNADFDADSHSREFERFLTTVQPDASIRAFLQRSIGYSLLGVVRERSFWILYGTGNNGKSIFVNLFNNLLGDYSSGTTAASIMAGKQSAIPNDIARLRGKRFIIIPETEENERLNAALVKSLSAGDQLTARFLFGEFFDFYFSGKLWIATNHKPTITDHSKGFWDRLKLVPFNQDIPRDQVIKSDDLMRSLMAESSGILNWAVTGCRDYFDLDGLEVPEIIQAEIAAYRREQDSISQFIEEECETIEQFRQENPDVYVIAADFQVKNADLYKRYKQFCDANGEFLRSHRRLTQNMTERGFTQKNSGGRFWQGIRLIEAEPT
jgi:putative DNA primase/helicase